MATRKFLKFKPKPVNASNIRRAKDKDESADVPQEAVAGLEKSGVNFTSNNQVSELLESKEQGAVNEALPGVKTLSNAVTTTGTDTDLSVNVVTNSLDSITNSNNDVENRQSSKSENCVAEKSVLSDSTSLNSETAVLDVNIEDEEHKCVNEKILQAPGKSCTGKGISRFGRYSKYKPVLSNLEQRKKTETLESSGECETKAQNEGFTENNENAESVKNGEFKENIKNAEIARIENCNESNSLSVNQKEAFGELLEKSSVPSLSSEIQKLNSQRTESVIKSVKSELSKAKPSIVSEITESFSLLESIEEDLPHISNVYIPRSKSLQSSSTRPNELDVENAYPSDVESSENSGTDSTNYSSKPLSAANKVPISPLRATSKVLVPKPSPRISDIGPRRISFQGSDSEEEVKKKKSYRKKENVKVSTETKDSQSNKRKRSQGSTYSKMSQETLDKFSKKFGKDEEPDKTKLTMIDLIFYNPKKNPMSQSSQNQPQKKDKTFEVNEVIQEKLDEENVDDVEPAPIPVPQLKIGPDGQIMLDPQSLVIETTGTEKGREQLEKSAVIQDSGITRYSTYRKKKNIRSDWSSQETLQFFRALNTVGTDFTLMTKLFPNRSRHDLKLKFKREEKINLRLVDKAMMEKVDFDFNTLQAEFQHENDMAMKKKLEKKLQVEAAQRKKQVKKEELLREKEEKRILSKKRRFQTTGKAVALKDFNDTDKGKSRFKSAPRKKRKIVKKKELCDSEEDDLHIDFDSNSEDGDLNLLQEVKKTCFNRIPKNSSKLKEYEEINETLKRKLEREEEFEEDGYIPNGPDAQMLFGNPLPAVIETEEVMDFEISSVPNIEETVLPNGDFTDVSEISELGSFGQNDSALDLSVPERHIVNTSLYSQRPDINPLLSSQIIAQSFQIVDQLTSEVQNITKLCGNEVSVVGIEDSVTGEVQSVNKTPLPSFESVSHARPSLLYPVEFNPEPELTKPEEGRMLVNFYNSTEEEYAEVIVGD